MSVRKKKRLDRTGMHIQELIALDGKVNELWNMHGNR
jgi:hypothetical protein